jgi:hypothetical protein
MSDYRPEPSDASAIAGVVADLRDGRVRHLGDRKMHREALRLFGVSSPTVVRRG